MRYEPATRVTTGPQPGALALRNYLHSRGFSDAGIWNPRNVRGSATALSLHAEGRAIDATPGSRTVAELTDLVLSLVAHHQKLGVQQVIWQRAVWTVGRTWRPYSGVDPHTSHAHIELTRTAATGLTVAVLEAVLDSQPEVTAQAVTDQMRRKRMFQWRNRGYHYLWDGEKVVPLTGCDTVSWQLAALGIAPNIGDVPDHEHDIFIGRLVGNAPDGTGGWSAVS